MWVAHNHPSGNPLPSPSDSNITLELINALDGTDINLLGNIVLGGSGRYSLLDGYGNHIEDGVSTPLARKNTIPLYEKSLAKLGNKGQSIKSRQAAIDATNNLSLSRLQNAKDRDRRPYSMSEKPTVYKIGNRLILIMPPRGQWMYSPPTPYQAVPTKSSNDGNCERQAK